MWLSLDGKMLAWIILVLAGLCETAWAIGMKYTEGWTRLWPTVWTLAFMVASVGLLERAMQHIPVGTAYAVWTGIGAVSTAALGIWLFDEPSNVARLVCMGLIAAGIIGLKVFS